MIFYIIGGVILLIGIVGLLFNVRWFSKHGIQRCADCKEPLPKDMIDQETGLCRVCQHCCSDYRL